MPGLVFALIASLAGFYSRSSWRRLWRPYCVGPILASVLAFIVVLALASVLTHSAGVRRAGIRTGVHLAGVHVGIRRAGVRVGVRRAGVRAGVCLAVMRAPVLLFKQASVLLLCWHSRGHLSCCHAGVCAGVCHAAVCADICCACWCHVLVVYHVVGAHVTISTTLKSMVSH